MNREELLDLLTLEADGGLDKSDQVRLDAALKADPSLVHERDAIQAAWSSLLCIGSSLKYSGAFDQQVAELMRPRPEGLLIGTPVRIAAAFFITAAILRAVAGPISAGTQTEVVTVAAGVQQVTSSSIQVGDFLGAAPGRPAHAEFDGGTTVDVFAGAVQVKGLSSLLVGQGELDVQVRFGARKMLLHAANSTISGTDAQMRVFTETSPTGIVSTHFEVQHGCIYTECSSGTVTYRAGDSGVLGRIAAPIHFFDQSPSIPRKTVTEPIPDPQRAIDVEIDDSVKSMSSQDDDSISNSETQGGFAQVLGTVTAAKGIDVGGTLVRLTRVVADEALLLELWQKESEHLVVDRMAHVQNRNRELESHVYQQSLDSSGKFGLRVIDSGLYRMDVLVAKESNLRDVPSQLLFVQPQSEVVLQVSLKDGQSLQSFVIDEDLRPLEGAWIRSETRETVSGLFGEFQLHGLNTDSTITIFCEGYQPRTVALAELGHQSIVLMRAPESRISIQDARDGTALSAAQVNVHWLQDGQVFTAPMDPDPHHGGFTTTSVPNGVGTQLVISAPGFATSTRWIDAEDRGRSTAMLQRVLNSPVQVLNPDGRPLARVQVAPWGHFSAAATTDRDGWVEFASAPGMSGKLVVFGGRHQWDVVQWHWQQESITVHAAETNQFGIDDLSKRDDLATWAMWVIADREGRWLEILPKAVAIESSQNLPAVGTGWEEQGIELQLVIGGSHWTQTLGYEELLATSRSGTAAPTAGGGR